MYRRLIEQEAEIVDHRVARDGRLRDPIAAVLPMAPTPSPSKAPTVSGSKERQLPINVSVVDLTSPARPGTVSDLYGDQTGHLSVATVLHEWVQHWKREIFLTHTAATHLTAEGLLGWIGDRLDVIAESESGIDIFAGELAELKSQLRHALGESTPKPVVMWGVPCRRCDSVSTLVLDPDDPDCYRECTIDSCGLLLSEDEYKQWLIEIVEDLKGKRLQ